MTIRPHEEPLDLLSPEVAPPSRPPDRPKTAAVDPTAYKVVSVRLRAAEFECFSEQAKILGLSNNMAMRIAARRVAGFLETDEPTRRMLQNILDEIGLIARALNDIDRVGKTRGTIDMDRLASMRAAFGQEFAQLDAHLRSILNLSRRRVDGRQMLRKAMLA